MNVLSTVTGSVMALSRITSMSKLCFSCSFNVARAFLKSVHESMLLPSTAIILSPLAIPAMAPALLTSTLSMTGRILSCRNRPPLFMLSKPRVSGIAIATSLPSRSTVTSLALHMLRKMLAARTLSWCSLCSSSPSAFVSISPLRKPISCAVSLNTRPFFIECRSVCDSPHANSTIA